MIARLTVLFLVLTMALHMVNAQPSQKKVSGIITDGNNNAIPFATVSVLNSSEGSVSDVNGRFSIIITAPKGKTLLIRSMGYQESSILLTEENILSEILITLDAYTKQITEVDIVGVSKTEAKQRTGFNTQVLETKNIQSLPSNINQALKTMPGLNIRESGGVGSGFTLSLNGLSGKQVRYFMDGIPTDNLGSVFNLNNFSVNMVENITVYKGVVPIELGADALGGAINIITPSTNKNYLDIAYSLGSFNTHLASVSGNSYNKETGFFIKGQAFYNYSDNNYMMYDVPVVDELGNIKDNVDTKRFNDTYKSGFATLETGVRDKRYADLLSIQLTGGTYKKNYQHTDFSTNNVFGKLHGTGQSITTTAKYKKTLNQFNVDAFVMYGNIKDATIDTSSYRYNWLGQIISETNGQGELYANKTLFRTTDDIVQSRLNTSYKGINNSSIDFSYAFQYLRKTGNDEVDENNRTFSVPNTLDKHTLGLGYSFKPTNVPIQFSAFIKQYIFGGNVVYYENTGNEIEELTANPNYNQLGYGTTFSYLLNNFLTFKASFENAYRTPENYEILGDGRYVLPNVDLKPEQSNNFNIGAHLNRYQNQLNWIADLNFFYRDSKDFIRVKSTGSPFGSYENINDVRSLGIEAGVSLNINRRWLLSLNGTFQDITDQTEFIDNKPNDNYGERVPNTPYLFWNSSIAYNLFTHSDNNKLTFRYSTRYVHEFSLTFEHLGDKDSKNMIPTQFIQDFSIDYSIVQGKYTVSLNAFNLANNLAYDNFKVQKPGRSMYLKFIYHLK